MTGGQNHFRSHCPQSVTHDVGISSKSVTPEIIISSRSITLEASISSKSIMYATYSIHNMYTFHPCYSSSCFFVQGKATQCLLYETRSEGENPINYTKYDIQFLIVFSVVTTLPRSTLNFDSLIISVRHKCATTFSTIMSPLLLSLLIIFHILINTKFVHVTSTYYHS